MLDLIDECQTFLDGLHTRGVSERDAAEALLTMALFAKLRADVDDDGKATLDTYRSAILSRVEQRLPTMVVCPQTKTN